MAALGAAGALVALRLLSRPRVAPAPFGPETPLPTPADLAEGAEDLDARAPLPEPDSGWKAEPQSSEPLSEMVDTEFAQESGAEKPSSRATEEFSAHAGVGSESPIVPVAFEPDATDDVPSHHVPPPVSDVVGEPVTFDADVFDVEPSHVPPSPVSEVTGEHTEAVFEAEEALAVPVVEAIASAATADAPPADGEGDFLTSYFNQLAETPVVETRETEASTDNADAEVAAEMENGAEEPLLTSVEEALSSLPDQNIAALGRRDAESFLDEGNVYFNVGQYGLAIERYGKALELDPELTAAYYNRANARTRAGEYDGALSDYDRALALQPHDADALNNRGMLHLYHASYGDALSDFNAALSIDPSDTTVMVNRGLAQLHGGDPAAALVDFQSAAALDNTDAAAHYGAAQAAAALENRSESLRYLSRAFEIDPGYAREAAADPKLQALQGDDGFMRLLRESGSRAER